MPKFEIDLPDDIHIDQVRAAVKALGLDIDPESVDFGTLLITGGTVEYKARDRRLLIEHTWWVDGTHPF